MVTGTVDARLQGIVVITVADALGNGRDFEATVDTGFTGFLTLPNADIRSLGLAYLRHDAATLGDGTTALIQVYEATISWDGGARAVEVIQSESTPLVGTRLLAGYRVRMDMVAGGVVEIEAIP
jgi:clan AA aspartic protease